MAVISEATLGATLRAVGPTDGRAARAAGALRVIAMVSDAIYPYHVGGKEVRYHNLAKGLAGEGIEVHVFTMRWWAGPRHRLDEGIHYHSLCRRYDLYHGRRRSIVQAVMFSLACLRLLSYRFDLIEADHMPHLQLFTIRLVAWLRQVPLVVTWHEVWGGAYWRTYLGRMGVIAATIEKVTMRLGDAIIAPSPGSAERLIECGIPEERVNIAPNGVDLRALESAPPAPDRFDLLYVGRLIEHKHVDLLLEAAALLARDGTALTVGIIGDGPERTSLVQRSQDLSLTGHVKFLGNFDQHEHVFSLMKSAQVFVLPSTREGFGVVVAEAIASGLVVVTTNHPDNHARSLLEEGLTGFCCEPTSNALAVALRKALQHPGPCAEARGRVQDRLSWASCTRSVLDVYRRTVALDKKVAA